MKKVTCVNNHRMVQIVPDLLLCECASYGRLTDMKGAVEDARKLVEASGGLSYLRDRMEAEEMARKEVADTKRVEARANQRKPSTK